MSESRTDTSQDRPHHAAGESDDIGHGKHRGGAADTDDSQSSVHGRHRRPGGTTNEGA
ncbi:hypothetical protein OG875_22760 [Streptomyces sp. NBC_01498]|uniref:hypothetical protein n=1 Tax=Streptomyces sp. NBC_01498 TaxID=2975870 RepID=UPI002E7ACDD8|nr:hypothetical protein [Streptomyces sp. NBC_01498]WTL27137.1 hypothetical protein OG875_22760 [Streptomyces sp. NBC_01498]